jgi:peptide-methionine (S)-S-oxide reductase
MNERAIAPTTLPHEVLGAPIGKNPSSDEAEAVFALGCFWGAERIFWKAPGVVSTAVGYIAGQKDEPSYYEVCSGATGHTEAVRVVYRPSEISFDDLLKLFWEAHDPTQGNRQGNDIGSQYRSGVYTTTDEQLETAQASRKKYEGALLAQGRGPITTELKPADTFWYAEIYHQQYLHKSCAVSSEPRSSRLLARTLVEAQEHRNLSAPDEGGQWEARYGLVPESVRHRLKTLTFEDIVIPCLMALAQRAA